MNRQTFAGLVVPADDDSAERCVAARSGAVRCAALPGEAEQSANSQASPRRAAQVEGVKVLSEDLQR